MKLWHGAKFELYKDRSAALNNFADFSHQALNFDRLWLSLIALITTEKSRGYFPQEVKGTAGRDSTTQRGMMQYYFANFPNPDFAMSIYREFSSESTRKAVKDLDEFRKVLRRAFRRCEEKQRTTLDYLALEKETNPRVQLEAPREASYRDRKTAINNFSGFKTRVHEMGNVDEASDEDPEQQADTDDGETKKEGHQCEEKDESTRAIDEDPDSWLHGISMDPEGKRPPPCFEFANKGKCPFKDCKYSHDASDIKEYLRLKDMGKEKFQSEMSRSKAIDHQFANRITQHAYKQNSGQGTKTYPRPEMKSGSTLRGGGSTARRL
jgi:hypothetical protein